jgi:hypothetical protein
LADVRGVELLEQPIDAVLGADGLLDQPEPGPHEIPGAPLRRRDHMGPRDQVGPKQLGQGVGVHLVGLDLGGGDRFDPRGVRQHQLDPEGPDQVGQPVPGAGRLDHGLVWAGELGEVGLERERCARHPGLFDAWARGAIGCDHAERLVLIDAGVPHGVPSWSDGFTILQDH